MTICFSLKMRVGPALAMRSIASTPASSSSHVLQHWSILEHVRQDHEPDLGSSDVDVLQLSHPAISVGHSHTGHLAVHVVLCLNQLATVDLMIKGYFF